MRRWINFVLLVGMMAGVAYTFNTKRHAAQASAELAALEREIEAERATIKILEADWSYLTQPTRLQQLTKQHADQLKLQPIAVEQFITFEELPNRPLNVQPYSRENALNGYAGVGGNNIQ